MPNSTAQAVVTVTVDPIDYPVADVDAAVANLTTPNPLMVAVVPGAARPWTVPAGKVETKLRSPRWSAGAGTAGRGVAAIRLACILLHNHHSLV